MSSESIPGETSISDADTRFSGDLYSTPVRLRARPTSSSVQSRFFQVCALPEHLVTAIHASDIERWVIRDGCQWRLDFPFPRASGMASDVSDLVPIVETILTRGTAPLCTPGVEAVAKAIQARPVSRDELAIAFTHIALMPDSRYVPSWFDSDDERRFYEEIVASRVSAPSPWHVASQVYLSSLSPDFAAEADERCDFVFLATRRRPIVVEIDGAGHRDREPSDRARDQSLANAGMHVVRIPVTEVRQNDGPSLDRLVKLLGEAVPPPSSDTSLVRVIRLMQLASQVQITVLEAIRGGWLRFDVGWRIDVVPPPTLIDVAECPRIVEAAIRDVAEIFVRLARLYGRGVAEPTMDIRVAPEADPLSPLAIVPHDSRLPDAMIAAETGIFRYSDICFPGEIEAPTTGASPLRASNPDRANAEWFLSYIFRKEAFREGQWEAIERALQGKDSVVLLPTGAGKSIAFQLAAILLPGRCVVVDPLLALIDDQIDNLARAGINRCVGITRQIQSPAERQRVMEVFANGHYIYCYVTPERFQIDDFRRSLRTITATIPISLVAIDEAHCVSEWGHDFRTAYLNLGRIARDHCASDGLIPPIMALTGTASKIVLKDVQRELGIPEFEAVITPKTFDRPELSFTILKALSSE
jgi:ATP-dependent DNA helicase RecQ